MKILLASEDPALRLSLEISLSEEPSVILAGTASEGDGLTALIRSSQPDLVVVDWDLPGHSPSKIIARSHRRSAHVSFIALGTSPADKEAALAAGADAFVVKGDPPGRLLSAFRSVRQQSKTASTATNRSDDYQ
jgi:DNA-binding NarL/FixJ family response regulator